MRTVRDAAFDVLRRLGGVTLFSNPGSTEIALLTDLSEDFHFVLALHEGSVVGMATGWAIARDEPAVVVLHTTAGLGNAIGALATARVNGAPLVVIVGQQDRRHLALEPFLAGRQLDDLVRPYAVWVNEPAQPQDVPGAIARAWHEAAEGRGPAVVIVPMDDWEAGADQGDFVAAPARVLRATAVEPDVVQQLASTVVGARRPVMVVGSGTDDRDSWDALVLLAERLNAPVWQEPFGARAGFPQDHHLFAGHLPSGRAGLRDALSGHDLVLVLGAAAFRQYPYEPGELIGSQTCVVVVTDDRDEAYRSPAELVVRGRPGAVCRQLAPMIPADAGDRPAIAAVPVPDPPVGDEPMRPEHVFAALAARLPREAVVVEESPSSRAALQTLLPAREPLGFLSAAMGGLGFGLPAAVGVRMASAERPVVAVLGDGSSMYAIQALWSAAKYDVGVLFVVLANGRYAIMDTLARLYGETTPEGRGVAPWPSFEQINLASLATSLGCPAREVSTYQELLCVLDEVVPSLESRKAPLLVAVSVLP